MADFHDSRIWNNFRSKICFFFKKRIMDRNESSFSFSFVFEITNVLSRELLVRLVSSEELFNMDTFEYGRLMKDGSRFGGNAFNRLEWSLIYGAWCVRSCKFVSLFVNFLSRILMALMEG